MLLHNHRNATRIAYTVSRMACLLAVALWGFCSLFRCGYGFRHSAVILERGRVCVGWGSSDMMETSWRGWYWWGFERFPDSALDQLGVDMPRLVLERFGRGAQLEIPMYVFVVLLAVPVGILWMRGRPIARWECATCRYNLTGNLSGVCPECGAPIPEEVRKEIEKS
jgi:hypothetical protein